jgi:hypothetical protein
VALRPAFVTIVASDVAIAMPPRILGRGRVLQDCATDLRRVYGPASPNKGARFRSRGDSTIQDATLGELSRVYDLTVLNRPGNSSGRLTTFELALFESGRPRPLQSHLARRSGQGVVPFLSLDQLSKKREGSN